MYPQTRPPLQFSGRFIKVLGAKKKTFKQGVFVVERLLHQKNLKIFVQKKSKKNLITIKI